MAAAMVTIPIVDGGAKYLSKDHSPLFISFGRYATAALFVLPIAWFRFGRNLLPRTELKAHFFRTVFLMAAMTLFFVAISKIPLATATSAYFTGPIIAVVLAVIFLKERLTVRKTLALFMGFVGSILILRPTGDIEPGILLAMGSGFFFALYIIATRMASKTSDPLKTLAFQCLVGAMILSPLAIFFWSTPDSEMIMVLLGMGAVSSISHLMSIAAFRFAEASVLAPLVYVELVGATIVGLIAFGEFPGLMVWLGAAVIVSGGLLLIQRQKT